MTSAPTAVHHREHEHGAVCRPLRRQEGKESLEVFVFLFDKRSMESVSRALRPERRLELRPVRQLEVRPESAE